MASRRALIAHARGYANWRSVRTIHLREQNKADTQPTSLGYLNPVLMAKSLKLPTEAAVRRSRTQAALLTWLWLSLTLRRTDLALRAAHHHMT